MISARTLGSFRFRLVFGSIIWIVAGSATTGFLLYQILRDRVHDEFVGELDHHATELAAIVVIGPNGAPTITQPLSDHRFDVPRSGYFWQVRRDPGGAIGSASLDGQNLTFAPRPPINGAEHYDVVPGPGGTVLQTERSFPARPAGERVRVAVAIDTREIDSVIVALRRTLGMALSIMAVGLIGAAIAQITFGLWPLSRIRRGLAAIRLGHARRLPDDLPAEVMPLAQGLNDVLAANEVVVQRARIQAGNLAHALKTPLAVLMDEAERLKARGESGALILRECERMRRQIESHLARARAAASSASVTAATPLMPALASLVSAIGRLYRDRDLRFEMPGDDHEILVSCEAEDLDEILGNLMDNAAKWARTRIAVRIDPSIPGRVRIFVEDDGPGMPADASESVFRVGQRLDEQMPGSGLGLAIVRDVAELYGGRAWIERTDGDGTTVGLELPAEVPAMSPVVRRERPN